MAIQWGGYNFYYITHFAWITYYSYDLTQLMGKERFDWDNPEHRARLEQAYQELGLDDFRHD